MSGYCHSQVPLPVYPYDESDEVPATEPVAEIPCAALVEAKSHLRVALWPWGDDRIIIGHIRAALALLEK